MLHVSHILSNDFCARYYGCGLVIPSKVEGMKILDLGSGSGRDCFVVSKLVGQDGHVTGIDMTQEQVNHNLTLLNLQNFLFSRIVLKDTFVMFKICNSGMVYLYTCISKRQSDLEFSEGSIFKKLCVLTI